MNNMKQQELGLNLSTRRTRRAVFLDEMNLVVPWTRLLSQMAPHVPRAKTVRPPFELSTMRRIHFLQQRYGLSDLAMKGALFETTLYREFAGLSSVERLPDRVSILRFRHLLEEHQLAPKMLAVVNATLADKGLMLKQGTVADATLIAAPSSAKNKNGERDPQMHQAKKGNQWHFGMKAESPYRSGCGLGPGAHRGGHSRQRQRRDAGRCARARRGNRCVRRCRLLQGVGKREEVQDIKANWHVAMRPAIRRALAKSCVLDQLEYVKASIRAKVEDPISGHQTRVRAYDGALPGTGQEHCAVAHAVRALQSVDGAASASAGGCRHEYACTRARSRPQTGNGLRKGRCCTALAIDSRQSFMSWQSSRH